MSRARQVDALRGLRIGSESSAESRREKPTPLSFGRERERSVHESLIGKLSRFVSATPASRKPITRYP
jgi:hypothetical protein